MCSGHAANCGMLNYVTALAAYVVIAAPIALKFTLAIGALGSAIELVGMFAQRFANPRAQAVGAFLIRVGKALEAVGADAPKFIANALGWVSKFAKLFGTAAIFLLVCAIQLGLRK